MLDAERVIYVMDDLDEELTETICRALVLLDAASPEPILMLINCCGGGISEALAIITLMRSIASPVWTCCLGEASSGAALLLMAGHPGRRFISPWGTICLHPLLVKADESFVDIHERVIETRQDEALYHKLIEVIASCTGRLAEEVSRDMQRPRYFDCDQALAYGIADHQLDHFPPA